MITSYYYGWLSNFFVIIIIFFGYNSVEMVFTLNPCLGVVYTSRSIYSDVCVGFLKSEPQGV